MSLREKLSGLVGGRRRVKTDEEERRELFQWSTHDSPKDLKDRARRAGELRAKDAR